MDNGGGIETEANPRIQSKKVPNTKIDAEIFCLHNINDTPLTPRRLL